MSNRFKDLVTNKKEKATTNTSVNDKSSNKEKTNMFKSSSNNRFNVLNEKEDKPIKPIEKKENRFQSLLDENEAEEERIYDNKPIKQEKYDKQDKYDTYNNYDNYQSKNIEIEDNLFPDLIEPNGNGNSKINTTSASVWGSSFKDKLLIVDPELPVTKKVKQVEKPVVELTEAQKEMREKRKQNKEATVIMCKIISKMNANTERQRRFYDSVYGNGSYDLAYDRIVDKYELLYGKDSWYEDHHRWVNIDIYDSTNDSDDNDTNNDNYDYNVNETMDNDNNRYKWF
jgi:hypothetical protein